jgi:hypothetical protein
VNILKKVKAGMMDKLAILLPEKMGEKGMQVVCCTKGPEEQADFFFHHLQSLAL